MNTSCRSLLALVALACAARAAPPAPGGGFLVENRGQWREEIVFAGRSGELDLVVGRSFLCVRLHSEVHETAHVVRFDLDGADESAAWRGREPLEGVAHFLLGVDPDRWQRAVPRFAAVEKAGVLVGVGSDVTLALPAGVGFTVAGAVPTKVSPERTLLQTAAGVMEVVSLGGQGADSATAPGSTRWSISTVRQGSEPGAADLPGVEWSTYLGGSKGEATETLFVDGAGDVILAGSTISLDFPTTLGAVSPMHAPSNGSALDAFITKLAADGSRLVWSTYLGGSSLDEVLSIEPRGDGTLWLGGGTASHDFPVSPDAYDTSPAFSNGFVARLTDDGSTLVAATALGGDGFGVDQVRKVLPHPSGDVIAVGRGDTADFPTTPGSFDPEPPGGFVARLDSQLTTLKSSTFVGGMFGVTLHDATLDDEGDVIVAGSVMSGGIPAYPFTVPPVHFGSTTALVARIAADGSRLHWARALDGDFVDQARAVRVGPLQRIYVLGTTTSKNFPVTPGAYQTIYSGVLDNGFVTILDPTGEHVLASTFVGSTMRERLAVDAGGCVLIAGHTSGGLPVTEGAAITEKPAPWIGLKDLIVSKLGPDLSSLHYSTLFGGTDHEDLGGGHTAFGLGPRGAVVVSNQTRSEDYPTTPGAFQESKPGVINSGVTKLTLLPRGVVRFGAPSPGCAGELVASVTAMPRVGKTDFAVNSVGQAADVHGLLLLSAARLDAPVPASGLELWVDPAQLLLVLPAPSRATGYAELAFRVPEAPGLTVYAQLAFPDPCAPGGWAATDALAIEIQP